MNLASESIRRGGKIAFYACQMMSSLACATVLLEGSVMGADVPINKAVEGQNPPSQSAQQVKSIEDHAQEKSSDAHEHVFAVGVLLGASGATGNRGLLWKGASPDVKVMAQYWFRPSLAMQLELINFKHDYEVSADRYSANILQLGMNLNYYLATQSASATLNFLNPHLILGFGDYAKTELASMSQAAEPADHSLGLNAGFGLEFPIVSRETYISFETRAHFVNFKDTESAKYGSPADGGFENLKGFFYTFHLGLVAAW